MTVRNLHWELETTFTRKEVIQMAKLAEYIANIQSHLLESFNECRDMDWEAIRKTMSKFSQLGAQDTLAYRGLCEITQKINDNKMMFLSGKVVEKETP